LQAIKAGHRVLYRSVFDLVRDFLQDEALSGEDRTLTKYLKPELLIVDDTHCLHSSILHHSEFLFSLSRSFCTFFFLFFATVPTLVLYMGRYR
jgi:DNA replication protein DnaC